MRADHAGQILLYGPPKPKAARKAGPVEVERDNLNRLAASYGREMDREDDGGCVTGGPMPECLRNKRLPIEPPPPPKLAEPPAKPRSARATQVLALIVDGESVIDEIVVFRAGGDLSSSQVRHARAELIERGEAEYTGGTSRTTSGKLAKEWRRKGGPR